MRLPCSLALTFALASSAGCSLPRSVTGGADGGAMDAFVAMNDVGPGHDAYAPGVDAYVPPGVDAFVPGVDAFVPPVDAYVPPPVDAFVPPVDAFVPPVDAFVPPVDAYVPPVDAYVPRPDAWTRPDCNAEYGGETGYILCSETATTCQFYVTLGGSKSCDDICGAHMQTCTGAINNGGSGSRCAATGTGDTCSSTHQDELCTCTRP